MKKYLSLSPSEEHSLENEDMMNQFMKGMLMFDVTHFSKSMPDGNYYFGNKTKWRALKYLQSFFNALDGHSIACQYERMVSLDKYPGCSAFRFDYYKDSSSEHDFEFFDFETAEKLLTLRLVPLLDCGKLIDLVFCRHAIPESKAKEWSKRN